MPKPAVDSMSRNVQIGRVLMLALQDFQRRLQEALKAHHITGIRQRHQAIFLHIASHGACRSADLAKAMAISPQSMMAIIHELEKMALVERRPDPTDSRAKLIDFTDTGRDFIRRFTLATQDVWEQYEKRLGKKQIDSLYTGLEVLTCLEQDFNKQN